MNSPSDFFTIFSKPNSVPICYLFIFPSKYNSPPICFNIIEIFIKCAPPT